MGSQSVTSPFTCSLVILTLQWTQRWFPSSIFTDEQPLFNAMGHPIKENLDKVICTCTYRMNQRISKHGVSVPLWGLQKSNMKLQSYFDIGNHTRNSNFSDVLNLWCFSFYFFFSSFNVMSIWKIFHQHHSKRPCGANSGPLKETWQLQDKPPPPFLYACGNPAKSNCIWIILKCCCFKHVCLRDFFFFNSAKKIYICSNYAKRLHTQHKRPP